MGPFTHMGFQAQAYNQVFKALQKVNWVRDILISEGRMLQRAETTAGKACLLVSAS